MAKRPVDYECPLELQDPLGTCLNFSPSYDVAKLSDPGSEAEEKKLLRVIRKEAEIEDVSLDDALSGIFSGKLSNQLADLESVLNSMKSPLGGDLELLLKQGRVRDLLPPRDAKKVYMAHLKSCERLRDDDGAFRAAGCKRVGHILLPSGRDSFRAFRPPDWQPVQDDSLAARMAGSRNGPFEKMSPKQRTAAHKLEQKQRRQRLERHEPPLDARTQSLKTRESLAQRFGDRPPVEEGVEAATYSRLGRQGRAYADAIITGVQSFSKLAPDSERSADPRRYILLPQRFEPLEEAGVPPDAAKDLTRLLGGAEIPRMPVMEKLSSKLSKILGKPNLITDGEKLFFFSENVDLRNVPRRHRDVRAFIAEAQGYTKTESQRGAQKQARGPAGEPLFYDDGSPMLQPKVARRMESFNTKVWVSVDLLLLPLLEGQPDRRVPLPVGERSWPVAFDTAAEKVRNVNQVQVVLKKLSRSGDLLGDTLVLYLQHSKLFGVDAGSRQVDYDSLRDLSLPQIAARLAQQKFSKRRRLKGRTREPYTFEAKTNPLPTYTLTAADLDGPAHSLDGGEVDEMGPGTYKNYGNGKFIYWGTKKGSQPKVVSAERLHTWMTVAKYGAKISQAAAGGVRSVLRPMQESGSANLPFPLPRSLAANNPLSTRKNEMSRNRYTPQEAFPKYSEEYLENTDHLNRQTSVYYPGTVWDYYKTGAFGPESSVAVNRRNPANPRKSGSAAQHAWNEKFEGLLSDRNNKLILQKHMHAAWAEILPESARSHPIVMRAIKNHMDAVLNNPSPAFDNPNPYALDMGPYGPSLVPTNRRNPSAAGMSGVRYARYPSKCAVCGEAFVTKHQAAMQAGTASKIVDSGLRGPLGGKKMKHVDC